MDYVFSRFPKNKQEHLSSAEVNPGFNSFGKQIAFPQDIKELSILFLYQEIYPYNSYKFDGFTKTLDTFNRSQLKHLDFGVMLQKKKK